ncbi:MAG: CDP-alcohol phosphatidyltransferase family protein [Acidobacteria bacterium]|nr:CDP-alcohol phosphatidyltransferase family protein [Acidobacteriota bacterium]
MVRKAVLINQTLVPARETPRLAGLPLLLRAVLAAQRAGIEEIIIVGGDDPEPVLGRDARVHLGWGWIPVPGTGESELEALRAARERLDGDFLLLFADSVFDARTAGALCRLPLDGRKLVAAHPADMPEELEPGASSLFLCSVELFAAIANAPAGRIASLYPGLRAEGRAASVEAQGRLWPRTSERRRLRSIHRELTHFNLKPSDGIFARFNKLVVGEWLIRLFLKTPFTPNAISLLGLALAVGATAAFIQGNYWWSLLGAVLAYFSAIMDHVDGMVARLKFLESEFGVWLESAVDFASYLFIFTGLAAGLYRETGQTYTLVLGGLFAFATIVSFIALSRQRRLASADNPTDFPNRIHTKLEEQSSNFLHWFTRKFYFLTRRAVLPYIILAFCLLDLRVLLLAWVTFGANLVWILTLYNNRLFRRSRQAPAEAD